MRECIKDHTTITGGYCRQPDDAPACHLDGRIAPADFCPYYVEIKNDKEDNDEMKTFKLIIKKREFVGARDEAGFIEVEVTTGGYTWPEVDKVAQLLVSHGQRVEIVEEKE